jgi:cell division protein FtsW
MKKRQNLGLSVSDVSKGYNKDMSKWIGKIHVPDLVFFSVMLVLAGLGLVMVYSSSSITAWDRFEDSTYYLKRQSLFLICGFLAMFFVIATDYHRWVKWGGYILGLTSLALVLVFVPSLGQKAGGAQRWLNLGGFALQPGEFAKLSCILYMTWALVRKGENVKSFAYGLLPMGLVAATLAALLLKQPDFGNAVVLLFISGVLMFLAGCRISYLLATVLWSLPILFVLIMGVEYRRKRLMAFLDPWSDPQHTSYQIIQSFTAFFQGGLTGTGLGNSKEKLYYLPEVHTDFIGSVLGEELGFLGFGLVVFLFMVLIIRGFRIASRAPDATGFLLAAGCTTLIGIQALLNLCVILGLVPTKGLPLPFFSHGGSSLLVTLIACGFIQSVARKSHLEGPAPFRTWLAP